MSEPRFRSYIAGQWVEGEGGHADENPADLASPVGHYGVLDAARTAQAVDAASTAAPEWGLSSPQQRADILDFVGSEILARKEELGRLLAREEGTTLAESIGEAARAGQIFRFFAGAALRRHIQIRDRYCVFPGCRRTARACDIDHTVEFRDGGPTTAAKCRIRSSFSSSSSDRSDRLLVATTSTAPRAASRSSVSTTPSNGRLPSAIWPA